MSETNGTGGIVLPSRKEVQSIFAEHGVSSTPSNDRIVLHDRDTEIPVGLPKPNLWRITVMPVEIERKSKGGIIFADDTLDAALWTHQLCKIAALGPLVMNGPAYAGYDIKEEDKPKVGSLWLVDPKQPRRYAYKDLNFIIVNDDQLLSEIPEDCDMEDLKFFGFNLAATGY